MKAWIAKLRDAGRRLQERVGSSPRHQETYHHLHWLAHGTYFAAVSIEGHGLYALTAVVLLALTVLAPLFGSGD